MINHLREVIDAYFYGFCISFLMNSVKYRNTESVNMNVKLRSLFHCRLWIDM